MAKFKLIYKNRKKNNLNIIHLNINIDINNSSIFF